MSKNIIRAAFVRHLHSLLVIVYIHHSRKQKCLIWLWLMWKRWQVEKAHQIQDQEKRMIVLAWVLAMVKCV